MAAQPPPCSRKQTPGKLYVFVYVSGESTMQSVFDQITPAREKAIQAEFALQANKPIDAKWFLALSDETLKRSGMLGYVIGFRIGERYLKQANDKQEALRNIVTLSNPQIILEGRGY